MGLATASDSRADVVDVTTATAEVIGEKSVAALTRHLSLLNLTARWSMVPTVTVPTDGADGGQSYDCEMTTFRRSGVDLL